MITSKIMAAVFSQDAAGMREPKSIVRKGHGYDIKKGMARGIKSDTGQDIKRYAPRCQVAV